MINRIVDFSVNNRFLVFIVTAVVCMLGYHSMTNIAIDALPNLGENQVIIYSQWDRSPTIIEDQITYPIVTAMLGASGVRSVRGLSHYGASFVYVLFEEGTDLYWARSRVQEYLSNILPSLPEGSKTVLGPDANGLGWIFQYVLEDPDSRYSLAEIRSFQDWYLRYQLSSVPGVAEVASVGGYVKQYQIKVDPNRLREFDISLQRVVEAVKSSSSEVGGRLLEVGGMEYTIIGKGYAQTSADFANIVVGVDNTGLPVTIEDIGTVAIGPDMRRGLADLDGNGDVVSGIVVMRQGQNALEVARAVRQKIAELEHAVPEGLKIVPVYDRSDLILRAIDTLKRTLTHEILVVVAVIFLFLWHFPSALIPAITIPIAVMATFIPLKLLGLSANIMSLGGIAIAVGAMIDASIVVVEQTHKKLSGALHPTPQESRTIIVQSIKEVAGPSFFALLVIAVSFLPVFSMENYEGRLFMPLAYTKTFSMIIAAVLAISLDPAIRVSLVSLRQFSFRPWFISKAVNRLMQPNLRAEEDHAFIRFLMRVYEPLVEWALRRKFIVLGLVILAVLVTIPVFKRLGNEFMPPFDEGALLFMPSTMPGISIAEAQRLLQATDHIIAGFPEVERVLGKAGRASTSTDPAPLSMIETVIMLKPRDQWRKVDTWYSDWSPEWLKPVFRIFSPDALSTEELIDLLNRAIKVPGLTNGWTMPIKGRFEMLSTGLRTPLGIKVMGTNLEKIEKIGAEIEKLLPTLPGTRNVFAERAGSGFFLEINWDRERLAQYGLSLDAAQLSVESAIGGKNITTTVEGRERYPVNVRYFQDYRSNIELLKEVLVSSADGSRQIPLAQLAHFELQKGPSMIRNENGFLTGYVYIDIGESDIRQFIAKATSLIYEKIDIPSGYSVSWSGQYESMERVKDRLIFIFPLTMLLIIILLYLNTRSPVKTLIILLSVPFSAIGSVWLLYFLDYNLSIGVWIGLLALLGVDAETGIFMLLYLDLAYEDAKKKGILRNRKELRAAVLNGAVKRLRPKFMTVSTTVLGLLPIMWVAGTGADIMKRIAAPMIGGIVTSFFLELLLYPVIYELWKWHSEIKTSRKVTLSGDQVS